MVQLQADSVQLDGDVSCIHFKFKPSAVVTIREFVAVRSFFAQCFAHGQGLVRSTMLWCL